MKRRLILFFLLAMVSMSLMAQTASIAVLSHDGQITTFTGNKALISAYNAAAAGDVITLSPGQFDGTTIKKSLTIRGAGMSGDDATVINGSITVNEPQVEGPIVLEGLLFTSTVKVDSPNVSILKCYMEGFYYGPDKNPQLLHCVLKTSASCYNATFISCYIDVSSGSSLYSSIARNCIIVNSSSVGRWGTGNQYTNCIFDYSDTYNSAPGNKNIFNGCVYIGSAVNPMQSPVAYTSNMMFPQGTQYLKENTLTYELLDELQTTWLGTDGTQVGMHGGSFPFDPTTTNPQMKKFEVSSKTSADGKLSVNIEVDMK